MAYVTVTDAAGRVLFRRPATKAEIDEAIQVADAADAEAHDVLRRMAEDREAELAEMRRLDAVTAAEPTAATPPVLAEFPVETEADPFAVHAEGGPAHADSLAAGHPELMDEAIHDDHELVGGRSHKDDDHEFEAEPSPFQF